MKKILILLIAVMSAAMIVTSCTEKPVKRDKSKNMPLYNENMITQNITEPVDKTETPEEIKEEEEEEVIVDEGPEIIDNHVYTGGEINDELIEKILIGYWEFSDFGYSGGYNFFESGFLQLILEHEVNQTGIFMVRNNGIYFSLDSKNWDEDVLIVQSISNSQIIGAFGENILTLNRSDPALIKENSGLYLEDSGSESGIIDAASEAGQGVTIK